MKPRLTRSQKATILSGINLIVLLLVVLIRRGNLILGQIDIDSDVPDPFTAEEEAAVKQVADALAILL